MMNIVLPTPHLPQRTAVCFATLRSPFVRRSTGSLSYFVCRRKNEANTLKSPLLFHAQYRNQNHGQIFALKNDMCLLQQSVAIGSR